ncbi:hypothetical protein AK830_g5469 [Neonectria ditissima]|uniref:Uncharacterized protein n=1 Tax=Neonectria ditissima TaxID=78410 RepID=A0A0P7BLS2_9HYPO|nr:hypothetical protein AK830_g5469 [Neonectria ditissima]
MDFLKKAMAGQSGSSSSQQHNTTQQSGNQQDYVDKGTNNLSPSIHAPLSLFSNAVIVVRHSPPWSFGMAAKKSGQNVDPSTAEKITDAGRGMYEKFTGKKVDPKYSN